MSFWIAGAPHNQSATCGQIAPCTFRWSPCWLEGTDRLSSVCSSEQRRPQKKGAVGLDHHLLLVKCHVKSLRSTEEPTVELWFADLTSGCQALSACVHPHSPLCEEQNYTFCVYWLLLLSSFWQSRRKPREDRFLITTWIQYWKFRVRI